MIEVTAAAETFLADLVDKQDAQHLGIQVEVSDGGTPHAQISMSFLEMDQVDGGFVPIATRDQNVRLFTRESNDSWLEGGRMDFRENDTGGTIVVDAPNLHVPNVSEDSPLEDRVNFILHSEVNPSLRSHGGMVSLVEIVDGNTAVLQFGGGCQGCGMVDVTLKQGVERTLVEKIPELVEVRDVTDHSQRENAYYR
jgi:Fe/S biogenesis protein NfuA